MRRKSIFITLPILLLIVGIGVGVYWVLFHPFPLSEKDLRSLLQLEDYSRHRLLKEDLLDAIEHPTSTIENITIPAEQVADFVASVLHPPYGKHYEHVRVSVSGSHENEFETALQKRPVDDYTVAFLHIFASYDDHEDHFLVGLKYSASPQTSELPSMLSLNSAPQGISSALRKSLNAVLDRSLLVQLFKRKYELKSGNIEFYRGSILALQKEPHPYSGWLEQTGLDPSKDWIIARYWESGIVVDHALARLIVVIDPTTYQIASVRLGH